MENNLELLKNLFSHSSENVFILNYELEILWCNKNESENFLKGVTLKTFFESETLPLESKEYFFRHNELEFSTRVINFPELSIYVMQMSQDDVMFSFIKTKSVREMLLNQAAQIRESVMGISIASSSVQSELYELGILGDSKYYDITNGNCYKLLKTILNTTELTKYLENSSPPSVVNLTFVLEEFTDICSEILYGQIDISLKADQGLYIKADKERLMSCLLSLTILAKRSNPDCGSIIFFAEKNVDYISLTVSTGKDSGKTEKNEDKVLSDFNKLYESDSSNLDLLVVGRFCQTYEGNIFIADSPENGGKIYSLKFPFCNSGNGNASLHSPSTSYHNEKFSNYHIALSDIAEIY